MRALYMLKKLSSNIKELDYKQIIYQQIKIYPELIFLQN